MLMRMLEVGGVMGGCAACICVSTRVQEESSARAGRCVPLNIHELRGTG